MSNKISIIQAKEDIHLYNKDSKIIFKKGKLYMYDNIYGLALNYDMEEYYYWCKYLPKFFNKANIWQIIRFYIFDFWFYYCFKRN